MRGGTGAEVVLTGQELPLVALVRTRTLVPMNLLLRDPGTGVQENQEKEDPTQLTELKFNRITAVQFNGTVLKSQM